MDEAEVIRMAAFLNETHDGLCRDEISPLQVTELYRLIQHLMDETFKTPDQDLKVLLASLEYDARQYGQALEERLGMRN